MVFCGCGNGLFCGRPTGLFCGTIRANGEHQNVFHCTISAPSFQPVVSIQPIYPFASRFSIEFNYELCSRIYRLLNNWFCPTYFYCFKRIRLRLTGFLWCEAMIDQIKKNNRTALNWSTTFALKLHPRCTEDCSETLAAVSSSRMFPSIRCCCIQSTSILCFRFRPICFYWNVVSFLFLSFYLSSLSSFYLFFFSFLFHFGHVFLPPLLFSLNVIQLRGEHEIVPQLGRFVLKLLWNCSRNSWVHIETALESLWNRSGMILKLECCKLPNRGKVPCEKQSHWFDSSRD